MAEQADAPVSEAGGRKPVRVRIPPPRPTITAKAVGLCEGGIMASDDFEVVAFKILSYLYRCMKNGKKVDIASLRQLVGCNETYFGAVVRSLQSK